MSSPPPLPLARRSEPETLRPLVVVARPLVVRLRRDEGAPVRAAALERADAAPERVDPYAEDGCKNTALHIKPSMIADESLREEAINAFGPAPFDLDGTDVGFHFYTQYGQFDGTKFERKEGLRVCETHRYNPITTFIHDKDFTTFLDDKTAATAEDEIVTVKIKLGKGGWQHFQCKKSDAKDMQGDKY